MDEYRKLELLGVKVVEVDDLCREGSFVPGLNLAVVRSGLSPDRRRQVGEHLLSRAESVPTFELIRQLGVHIVEDPELDVEVCYIHPRRLAVIRSGLDQPRREWVESWLLAEMFQASGLA